jgi:hypothetical protein
LRAEYPCNFVKACHILYAVRVLEWSLTRTSIVLEVNLGTVSRVARGLIFPEAYPIPLPGFEAA